MNIQSGDPAICAIRGGKAKMPPPMTIPATIATALHTDSAGFGDARGDIGLPGLEAAALMELPLSIDADVA
jgi:hypothetical protein